MTNKPTIQQLVVFSILMENGGGICGKSVDYIQEKFQTVLLCGDNTLLRGMLDVENQAKFDRWLHYWYA